MGPKANSAHQADKRWIEMEHVSENAVHVVPEETLKNITKGPLAEFTLKCEDDQKVSRVFGSLLKTSSTESISKLHLATSCNALSAFLDAAVVSSNNRTAQLVFSCHTWLAVFEVYLNRFEYAAVKLMRQILHSLMRIMVKEKQVAGSRSLQSIFGDITIPCLILGEPRSRWRAALVAWESLIRKDAISISETISMVHDWLSSHHEKWSPVFDEDCKTFGIDSAQFLGQASASGNLEPLSGDMTVKLLVQRLLSQARNMDAASIAGSVIHALFEKARNDPYSQYLHTNELGFSQIWANPAKKIMLQNLEMLDSFSNYILHRLFTVDPTGFGCFVSQLPLKNLLTGNMADAPLEEFIVLFEALQIGKKIGIVHEDHYLPKGTHSKNKTYESLVLNSEVVGKFLLHRESSIRLAALSLLTMAISTTKPLTPSAMSAITKALPLMHADSDPYSRWKIWSLTQKLLVRLKGGGVLKDRSDTQQYLESDQMLMDEDQQSTAVSKPNFAPSDAQTRACLEAFVQSLCADLRPTTSYQRHIAALKSLIMILDSGLDSRVTAGDSLKIGRGLQWKFHMDILRPDLLRLLLDLLSDSFDDVRATALSIVNMFPRDVLLNGLQTVGGQHENLPQLIGALLKAERIASNTSRADHADTVARLYHILFCSAKQGTSDDLDLPWWSSKAGVIDIILRKIEEKLSLYGGLFNSSLRDAPLHGYLSGLRYIVLTPHFYSEVCGSSSTDYNVWRSIHNRIVYICNKIWFEVKPVLCVDSPEGHTDEPVEDLLVGPKDILSYSWRALRESSLLLYATLANSTYGPQGGSGLRKDDYESIGSSSFTQLAELRHRGAFSNVSQTFATCCLRCSQSNDPTISSLPQEWYQETIKLIFETASKLTRRSAGLPALITGILSGNPGGPLFHRVMEELHSISYLDAQQDEHNQVTELPQVHAMNCLKDIFTNAKLGPHAQPFIMPALTLSAGRIGSSIWAFRNAGLMLFRAILIRICRATPGAGLGFGGDSGSEPGARVSFEKYPGLLQLLSRLLEPERSIQGSEYGDSTMVTERVFPALELIGEKMPVTVYNVDDDLTIRRLVLEQFKSPIWGIREHSARVYASLLNVPNILSEIRTLLDVDREVVTQNYVHGKALCIRFALGRFAFAHNVYWNGCIEEIVATVRHSLAVLFPLATSPFVATALVEILNDTVEKSIRSGEAAGKITPLLVDVFERYDLNGILGYVLDSSHPSWKSLSATRASSLLRRALSWTAILKMFMSGQLEDLGNFFHTVSTFDPDAGRWLLERMQQTFGDKANKGPLSNLYTHVILGKSPEYIKVVAFLNLATILETSLDFRREGAEAVDLPLQELGKEIDAEAVAQLWNREMSDAMLRLQGCLVTAKATFCQLQSPEEFEPELRRWAIKLRSAFQEETEFTSRYAAVVSLTTFGRVLRPHGNPPRVDDVLLDIYLILYDMLNDDDEEIRDMAADTASWVLSYSSVSPSKSIAFAPMIGSKLFAQFIARGYSTSPLLCHRILQYITGQIPRISDSTETALVPIADLIMEYRKESTVLFVEEKQNLFIDDVCEIDCWSKALTLLAETSFVEVTLLRDIAEWVSEGLTYLYQISADETGQDGPLGWTSKEETFTLGIRVISLAAVLASSRFPARSLLGDSYQHTLKEKLGMVLIAGTSASLNVEWLSRIQAALETL